MEFAMLVVILGMGFSSLAFAGVAVFGMLQFAMGRSPAWISMGLVSPVLLISFVLAFLVAHLNNIPIF